MNIVVIIVTYNGMKWYQRCFDSLRASSVPVKAVVIDNLSSDGTREYIKENYPEIHLIESESNLGFGKANNIGFKYAIEQHADYVFLLNQDAWVMPDTFEILCRQLQKNPEYGILSPIHLNGTGKELDFNFSYYVIDEWCPDLVSDFVLKGKAEDRIYPVKFINAALWMMSRECVDKIGGFDPLFPHYGEDVNYIERLQFHGYKLGIYPHTFGVHDRVRGAGKTPTTKQIKSREIASLMTHLTNPFASFWPNTIRTLINYSLQSGVNNLLRLSFRGLWINTCVTFKVLALLSKVKRNRDIAKQKGQSFL
ncbi:glycosyltransferase family 2 protein [Dysgonomonas sp. 25]|uniref:glycosyltransferase family 2 protein n=1 Tax=Dysgonomonas sp. 25 TaxID=2302933 RepID=UPI0013D3A506|nr:glycosyltransferase family 2 protein [Dysgonomonas sp. 25]NDV68169.1 glycosyltransferase family 2 protein [Dysgonomonas sp. 25]